MNRFRSIKKGRGILWELRRGFSESQISQGKPSIPQPQPPKIPKKGKPNPAAGYKPAKLKKGEEVLSRRVYGDTNIFAKPVNFNFELRRQQEEKTRYNLVKLAVALSFVPIFIFIYNAQENFKKTQIKERARARRDRLDSEHGIDRDQMNKDYEKLAQIYRLEEKEEIEKMRQIGKTPQEYLAQKEMKE